jgi:hypothetical protein
MRGDTGVRQQITNQISLGQVLCGVDAFHVSIIACHVAQRIQACNVILRAAKEILARRDPSPGSSPGLKAAQDDTVMNGKKE